MNIRLAKYSERTLILDFINEHWQENHIFVRWPELFDDYHKDGDFINYMIAIDEETKKIYGVCGFIYANRNRRPDIWLALWKTIPSGIPSLGMDLVNHIYETLNVHTLACCGICKEVKPIYEFMGYKTGTLKHYYRLNSLKQYVIACIKDKTITNIEYPDQAVLLPLPTEEDFRKHVVYSIKEFQQSVPYKDSEYLIKKYYHNITYQYNVYGICKQNRVDAVIVFKTVFHAGSRALRIVDFLGNEKSLLDVGQQINDLLILNGAEYVDIYEHGLADETLKRIGFTELNECNENIIPNYFEPFEQTNVNIHFFSNKIENFRMFKADGDQERPNQMKGENR